MSTQLAEPATRAAETNRTSSRRPPAALVALMIGAFGIGMTEFIVAGLLPDISSDLHVSLSAAGLLVSGYAAGVAVGAPLLTALTGRLDRKHLLLGLMVIFIVGNLVGAIAPSYGVLMTARVIAAFAHGTFFAVGSIVATQVVPPGKGAAAIATMFTGLTFANVIGVPAGTVIGHQLGWRATFWVITALGVLGAALIAVLVPSLKVQDPPSLRQEVGVLRRPQVLLALAMTLFGYGGIFVAFTYIAPILEQITGFSQSMVTVLLVLFGLGLFVGNTLGGKLADRHVMRALMGILTALAAVLAVLSVTAHNQVAAAVTVFLLGAAGFGTVPGLQLRVMDKAEGAPNVASALNIGAFNLGIAGGAFLGGVVVDSPLGLGATPWVGALVTLVGLALAAVSARMDRTRHA
ncbi:MFS transporter [Oryzihumus leptocrescens]|uniref:DHA1 family inner membrane transport protein n=1 Tax=Oryzihumus leptocrescens TaxID=297536 RepID=A0A542ZN01_9MICO|nr:MFS transporter [Oryzihumus leptocrescens]TQL61649.1 DHA1 family inner membrane transport protein [Oryzihumus leptocrescens]